jgi:SAM-dependent MidA family methyltransferase
MLASVLLDKLRERIEAGGPMPFEEFMAASLYDPDHGFFATGPLRSAGDGDFLTSPEVSSWFGRTIGTALRAHLDATSTLVEVGAGSGSLLRPLLTALGRRPRRVIAVDRSPSARQALVGLDSVEVAAEIPADLGQDRVAVVANELLDNLPVALAVNTSTGWQERWVGHGDRGLVLIGRPARREVVTWCERYAGTVADGGLVEVQLEVERWLRALLSRIEQGIVLLIDYGGTAEELEPRRTQGTLRTYRAHHLGPDPFHEPGATDVTVDVNFTAVVEVARACGWRAELVRQDDFLAAHGLRDRVRDLREEERRLATGDDALARLRVRSEWKDAETLLHPRGLGDFRVAVLTHGTRMEAAGVSVTTGRRV